MPEEDKNVTRLAVLTAIFAIILGVMSVSSEEKTYLSNNAAWLLVIAQVVASTSAIFFVLYLVGEANLLVFSKNSTNLKLGSLSKKFYDIGVFLTTIIVFWTIAVFVCLFLIIQIKISSSIGTYIFGIWSLIIFLLTMIFYVWPVTNGNLFSFLTK